MSSGDLYGMKCKKWALILDIESFSEFWDVHIDSAAKSGAKCSRYAKSFRLYTALMGIH